MSGSINVICRLVNETNAAWCIEAEPDRHVWIPKSRCEFDPSAKDKYYGTFTVPVWLAEKEELI